MDPVTLALAKQYVNQSSVRWAETIEEADSMGGAVLLVGPPVQVATDFREYALGEFPSDWAYLAMGSGWTVRVEEYEGILSDRGLRISRGGDVSRLLVSPPEYYSNSPDQEVLSLMRISEMPMSGNLGRVFLRASENGQNCYFLDYLISIRAIQIRKYTGGTIGNITSSTPFSFEVGDDIWTRFRVTGDKLQAKAWHHGSPEPEEWMLEGVDASFSEGRVGLGGRSENNSVLFQFFSVGLKGYPALPPPGVDLK